LIVLVTGININIAFIVDLFTSEL